MKSQPTYGALEETEYSALDLRSHTLLADIPLHDVWFVDLPGGGTGRTLADVRAMVAAAKPGPATALLFGLRRALGRLFGWDRETSSGDGLVAQRLTDADRSESLVQSGKRDGPFTVLYVFEHEALSEIRNATVHAALVYVLQPRRDGYRLVWAIHTKPVGAITPIYLTLIDPFRKWIVYPSLFRRFERAWRSRYTR